MYNLERQRLAKVENDAVTAAEQKRDRILEGKDGIGEGFANVKGGRERAFDPHKVPTSDRYKQF
mgnify:CR=1 FL=1